MNEIMPYIWIGVIVFASVAEIYTFAHVSVWFIPSALIAFVLSLTGIHVWIQVLLFFIITLILLVLSRTIFKYFMKFKTNIADSDVIIGKNAIVTEEINNYKNTGIIRINGLVWTAKADENDVIYESGLVVTVVRIDGVKAVCSR